MNVPGGVYTPRVSRVAFAFGVLLGTGCAPAAVTGPGPARTVTVLAAALRGADVAAIAGATGRSEADVAASEATNGRELSALGETLARAPVERAARVTSADGTVVALVLDGDAWRVDRGVLGRPCLDRPADAVVALHDALARSRLQAALRLLARGPRAELEAELARWIDGTADPDALEVSVQGEAATVRTPTGEQLELVRESGQWRVVEIR